ncbi:sugar transferase [Corynebacterium halotolerans]|uniref:sugar transferase n=1 Tax=Corynebacterium halotolerans TaxID=225326 RepID=UPI003CF2CDE2
MLDTAIVVLSAPLTLSAAAVTAALVRVNLGRPVLFKQDRVGLDGQQFELLKFRSMLPETDAEGQFLSEEERLTSFGRLLRQSSMDELPQLLNVLRGEMSLVGPRPLLTEYIPYYTETELTRHSVRPGITGAAQVSGRNFLDWDDRLALDAQYAREATLFGDLKILWQTLVGVVQRKDTAAESWVLNEDLDEYRSYPSNAVFALRRIEPRDVPTCVRWFATEQPPEIAGVEDNGTTTGVMAWLHAARLDQQRKDLVVYDLDTRRLVAIAGYRTDPSAAGSRIYFVMDPEQQKHLNEDAALSLLVQFMKQRGDVHNASVELSRESAGAILECQRHGFMIAEDRLPGNRVRMEATW